MQAQLSAVKSFAGPPILQAALPTVFIVDNDESARDSLLRLLQNAGWQAESFSCAEEFLAHPRALQPACVIVDTDGLELQQALARCPEIPVIFLTTHRDIPMTVRAMKGGAVDFLIKPCTEAAIFSAVATAIERSRRAVAHQSAVHGVKVRYGSLSRREREVMGHVVSGRRNKQISADLGISEITVKAHRGRVMRKMAADSLVALVNMSRMLPPQPASGLRQNLAIPQLRVA
jgi:FixJ family two-component response regulator